jgi:predicted DNA-binding transcriptional regulator YafY
MLDLNELGKHICVGRIAGLLDVSKRTIYRHINDELKQEIKILNEEI